MNSPLSRGLVGLDFGTTNTVAALPGGFGREPHLVPLDGPGGPTEVFRSALCFWRDEAVRGGLAVEAGPAAIHEYLEFPSDSRFLQSFKSVAASRSFERASVFSRPYRFEELGRLFLDKLASHAGGLLDGLDRIVVGRPVHYAGGSPDPDLARQRYDAMFEGFAREIHYVYEPLAAAFSYASRLTEPATLLVADFGGGTSDFSVVRIGPGRRARADRGDDILATSGVRLGGTDFDTALSLAVVMPLLGLGTRLVEKDLPMPNAPYHELATWATINFAYSYRNERELAGLLADAAEPDKVGRFLAAVQKRLGHRIAFAVEDGKIALSSADDALISLGFLETGLAAATRRVDFEWAIAARTDRLHAAARDCIAMAGLGGGAIDTIFLTGGSSRVPAVRAAIAKAAPAARLASGSDLLSVALGLTQMAGRL